MGTVRTLVDLSGADACRAGRRRSAFAQTVILVVAFALNARGEEDDIRGPRPPMEIPAPETFSLTPWLAGAGALAAAAVLYWWWRRRGRRRETAAVDRAMNELNAIDRERNAVDAGPLADRTADVVRRFTAERFGIAAPQRTTEEFLHALAREPASPLAAHSALLRGFLKSCDMAKFAAAEFDAAERHALLEAAFRFVQASGSSAATPPGPDRNETA